MLSIKIFEDKKLNKIIYIVKVLKVMTDLLVYLKVKILKNMIILLDKVMIVLYKIVILVKKFIRKLDIIYLTSLAIDKLCREEIII